MKLDVWLHGICCGVLEIQDERFLFSYHDAYVQAHGPALSLSMPVRAESWGDRQAFAFFENLLPEAGLRTLVAENLGTDVHNITCLLERLGGEVAGAVSLTPAGTTPDSTAYLGEALDEGGLGRLLARLEEQPLLAGRESGPRLSLAGAQQKLPVVLHGNVVHVPWGLPSSHLLKPPSARFPGLPENEFVCMRAAGLAGLQVPEVQLRPYRDSLGRERYCLQVQRYDRIVSESGQLQRLHQEDICQALAYTSGRKYEADGGPGFAKLFKVVRTQTRFPAKDLTELLRRVFFNLLIGNADAHAKNFSLLYRTTRPDLAPAYDLVATMVYPQLDQSLAMKMATAVRVADVSAEALDAFGELTGTSPRRMRRGLKQFLEQSRQMLVHVCSEVDMLSLQDEAVVLQRLMTIVEHHHQVLQRALAG